MFHLKYFLLFGFLFILPQPSIATSQTASPLSFPLKLKRPILEPEPQENTNPETTEETEEYQEPEPEPELVQEPVEVEEVEEEIEEYQEPVEVEEVAEEIEEYQEPEPEFIQEPVADTPEPSGVALKEAPQTAPQSFVDTNNKPPANYEVIANGAVQLAFLQTGEMQSPFTSFLDTSSGDTSNEQDFITSNATLNVIGFALPRKNLPKFDKPPSGYKKGFDPSKSPFIRYQIAAGTNLVLGNNNPFNSNNSEPSIIKQLEPRSQGVWLRYTPSFFFSVTGGTTIFRPSANLFGGFPAFNNISSPAVLTSFMSVLMGDGIVAEGGLGRLFRLSLAHFKSMSFLSTITSLAPGANTNTNAVGFSTQVGFFSMSGAYQQTSIDLEGADLPTAALEGDAAGEGNSDTDASAPVTSHQVANLKLEAAFWDRQLFVGYGYQRVWGEKTVRLFGNTGLLELANNLDINIFEESESLALTTHTVAGGIRLEEHRFTVDYTRVSTPAFNETGSANFFIGLQSVLRVNYQVIFSKQVTLGFMYDRITSKVDEGLDLAPIQTADKKEALGPLGDILGTLLDGLQWNTAQSFGVSVNVQFGDDLFP